MQSRGVINFIDMNKIKIKGKALLCVSLGLRGTRWWGTARVNELGTHGSVDAWLRQRWSTKHACYKTDLGVKLNLVALLPYKISHSFLLL